MRIGVNPIKESASHDRVRATKTKPTYRNLLEQIVAEEEFVATLTTDGDCDARFPGKLCQVKHESRRSFQQWRLGVPKHGGKAVRNRVGRNSQRPMNTSYCPGDFILVVTLVELRRCGGDGKTLDAIY